MAENGGTTVLVGKMPVKAGEKAAGRWRWRDGSNGSDQLGRGVGKDREW